MYPPDGLCGESKHDVGLNPHIIAPDPFASDDCLDVFSPAHPFLLTTTKEPNTMSTGDDDPPSGLNGRLRPRKSQAPYSQTQKATHKSEVKVSQEKNKKTHTPSKASPNKQDDLADKSDFSTQFLCAYCDKKFASKQSVAKHARRVHLQNAKQDPAAECLFCNLSEGKMDTIVQHMAESHPYQYFACLDCHTRFSSPSDLEQHKLSSCDKHKVSYRSKLRRKARGSKSKNNEGKSSQSIEKHLQAGHSFNGVVISCELKPSQVHNEDIEDNITTNLILPSSKGLGGDSSLEKNAVIVLDDIQWNKRMPPNFSFHNTDADQILSRLGVVHRSPRTEPSKRDWLKALDDSTQKFERCFDTSFYSKVASNIQENLSKFLDGSFNFNPDPDNIIKTRKSKNSVVINTAEGFPILLASEQFSRNEYDGYMPRTIAPKHKWKWDSVDADKHPLSPDQIKRDSHTNNCIITLVSSLDIWTQLQMRQKFEKKFSGLQVEKKTEKKNVMISNELKEILESREIPSSSQVVKSNSAPAPSMEGLEFPAALGLVPAAPVVEPSAPPAVLSGEWARPRCYVCCACGDQTYDSRSLTLHISTQHPNAQVQHYEIVGETLLNADIVKHLYVPPSQIINRTRPPRGFRDCTKCKKSVTLEDLHQHMLDCAGDTPTVRRRQCRYRPFGVRRRRPRLPDNTVRKKMRKDIRSRQRRQKNHVRPRQRIRTEVGDAETIRKMIADLPAKRHRVLVNPMNQMSRTRRKLDKQRSMNLMKRQLRLVETKNKDGKTNDESTSEQAKSQIDKKSTVTQSSSKDDDDEDNSPLKSRISSIANKRPRRTQPRSVNRNIAANFNRAKRRSLRVTQKKVTENTPEPSSSIITEELSVDTTPRKIDVRSGACNTRDHANRGNSSRRNDQQQRGNGNDANGNPNANNANNYQAPTQTVPLKHSIASLTANSETHDKSVQFHHLFLVQQECNNTQNVTTGRRMFFENEAAVISLDKPPITCSMRGSVDFQKNKLNKPRKGLNACIAMLKNKLSDPIPCPSTGHISVQCGSDEPLDMDCEPAYTYSMRVTQNSTDTLTIEKNNKVLEISTHSKPNMSLSGTVGTEIELVRIEKVQVKETDRDHREVSIEAELDAKPVPSDANRSRKDKMERPSRRRNMSSTKTETKESMAPVAPVITKSKAAIPKSKPVTAISSEECAIPRDPYQESAPIMSNIDDKELERNQKVTLNSDVASDSKNYNEFEKASVADSLIIIQQKKEPEVSITPTLSHPQYDNKPMNVSLTQRSMSVESDVCREPCRMFSDDIPADIPPAHSCTNVESIISAPLDLSGKMVDFVEPTDLSEPSTSYAVCNYDSYGTLDLSNKTNKILTETEAMDEVVDLSIKSNINMEVSDLSLRVEDDIMPTDLSIRRECTSPDDDFNYVHDLSSHKTEEMGGTCQKHVMPTGENIVSPIKPAKDNNRNENRSIDTVVRLDTKNQTKQLISKPLSLVEDTSNTIASPPDQIAAMSTIENIEILQNRYYDPTFIIPQYKIRVTSTSSGSVHTSTAASSDLSLDNTKPKNTARVATTSRQPVTNTKEASPYALTKSIALATTPNPADFDLSKLLMSSTGKTDSNTVAKISKPVSKLSAIGNSNKSNEESKALLVPETQIENRLQIKDSEIIPKVTKNVDQDQETAKKIALLPKELVEILGNMPADHRNQLLNVLPQYVSPSTVGLNVNIQGEPQKQLDDATKKQIMSDINSKEGNVDNTMSGLKDSLRKNSSNLPKPPVNIQMPQIIIDNPLILQQHNSVPPTPVMNALNMSQCQEEEKTNVVNKPLPREETKKIVADKYSSDQFTGPKNPTATEYNRDRIIDLTNEESGAVNACIKISDPVPHSIPLPSMDVASVSTKPSHSRGNNDRTASLRAVRIKTPSERQKSNQITQQCPVEQKQITTEENEANKSLESNASLAIQQAEISSTQHGNKNNIDIKFVIQTAPSESETSTETIETHIEPQKLSISDSEKCINEPDDIAIAPIVKLPCVTSSIPKQINLSINSVDSDLNSPNKTSAVDKLLTPEISNIDLSTEKFLSGPIETSTPKKCEDENFNDSSLAKNPESLPTQDEDSDDDISLALIVKQKQKYLQELVTHCDENVSKMGTETDGLSKGKRKRKSKKQVKQSSKDILRDIETHTDKNSYDKEGIASGPFESNVAASNTIDEEDDVLNNIQIRFRNNDIAGSSSVMSPATNVELSKNKDLNEKEDVDKIDLIEAETSATSNNKLRADTEINKANDKSSDINESDNTTKDLEKIDQDITVQDMVHETKEPESKISDIVQEDQLLHDYIDKVNTGSKTTKVAKRKQGSKKKTKLSKIDNEINLHKTNRLEDGIQEVVHVSEVKLIREANITDIDNSDQKCQLQIVAPMEINDNNKTPKVPKRNIISKKKIKLSKTIHEDKIDDCKSNQMNEPVLEIVNESKDTPNLESAITDIDSRVQEDQSRPDSSLKVISCTKTSKVSKRKQGSKRKTKLLNALRDDKSERELIPVPKHQDSPIDSMIEIKDNHDVNENVNLGTSEIKSKIEQPLNNSTDTKNIHEVQASEMSPSRTEANTGSIPNIDDVPLRRSKRGKSFFIEDNLQQDTLINTESAATPLTKKQLIFSKLLLDEEIHTKTTNIQQEKETSLLQITSLDDQSNAGEIVAEKSKSTKRKITPQSKQKYKKKKSIDIFDHPAGFDILADVETASENDSKSVPKDDVPPEESASFGSFLLNSTTNETKNESHDLTNESTLTSSTEKRKIDIDSSQSDSKPKKTKFSLNKYIEDIKDDDKNLETTKNKSMPCYSQPVAGRRTRSKSFNLKSSKTEIYDPYDIDLDDMDDKTEPFRKKITAAKDDPCKLKKGQIVTAKLNNSKAKDIAIKEKQRTLSASIDSLKVKYRKDEQISSNEQKIPETITVKTGSSDINIVSNQSEPQVDESNKTQDSKKNSVHSDDERPNFSDSDESSKSDVPLKKYVEEKEKKVMENKMNPEISSSEKEAASSKSSLKVSKKRTVETLKKKKEMLPVATKDDTNETEEQLRSEQFMESFGFFCERKPRKSNLLATKKISETFHIIANEAEDVYFGYDQRTAKKTQPSNERESNSHQANKKVKRGRKKKSTKITPAYCGICKKEFRRSDNYLRHQMTLLHISKLSEVEMKVKTSPVLEEPNYLIAYKQQLDRLKILTNKLAKQKKNSKNKIKLPTIEEILAEVNKTVREQQISRGLSRDEALFLDCCELLKESHKNDVPSVETSTLVNSVVCPPQTSASSIDVISKIHTEEKLDSKSDGDVDSITAKTIMESEEVRNLENDLISGLKEAAAANIEYKKSINDMIEDETKKIPKSDANANIESTQIAEEIESNVKKHSIETKEKMYPDLEPIDLFEDKFDKIKRKCRSQAAAAKQHQTITEPSSSHKSRKKDKKKGKKSSKKSAVLTKGALKGFDGIKVSIPTSDINISAIVSPIDSPTKKRKKSSSKKKRDKRISETSSKYESDRSKDSPRKKIDIYEFMDNEEAELFEFRPSTLMERFKNICNRVESYARDSSKLSPAVDDDYENSIIEESGSDGDDFVYMSDDYVCSDDETVYSLMSCETGNLKSEIKRSAALKRKDVVEKNAVMGKIFKHNAVRSEKKIAKTKDSTKPKANLDQLFDSLLEDEPSFSANDDMDSPRKDNGDESNPSHRLMKYATCPLKSPERFDSQSADSFDQSMSPTSLKKYRTGSPKDFRETSPSQFETQSYDSHYVIDYGPSTSKKEMPVYRPSSPKKYEMSTPKKPDVKKVKYRESHPQSDKREESYEFGADGDSGLIMDDTGVARQRARRKCTVGKQNVLAETWSSESEPDVLPPRPNSAESAVASVARKRKGKKREGQHSGGRRSLKYASIKKQDIESRVTSSNRATSASDAHVQAALQAAAAAERAARALREARAALAGPSAGPSGVPRPRARAASFWAEDEQERLQQHGWIVGDSHKKLVTMLAHAKGRKRNNDDKRHLVE